MSTTHTIGYDTLLQRYREHVGCHGDIIYEIETIELPKVAALHKWVGAQIYGNALYAFPNDMSAFLRYDLEEKKCSLIGELGDQLFKWTGGCVWKDYIYAFPRSSNDLLKLDPKTGEILRISCCKTDTLQDSHSFSYLEQSAAAPYDGEHHYGGVCTKEGVIYQPPRGKDHLLVWDLNTEQTRRIQLAPPEENRKFRYCGSIIHPNGYAYFIPESDAPVIKLNLRTEEWCFIGENIATRVFDAKIAADGNVYGFSAYEAGILKITVDTDETEMIHTEIRPASYGTKLGVNGKMYSVPGDGQNIWEYDPGTDQLQIYHDTENEMRAKYAGGVTTADGTIIMVPPQSPNLCILRPKGEPAQIEEELYRTFWMDNY